MSRSGVSATPRGRISTVGEIAIFMKGSIRREGVAVVPPQRRQLLLLAQHAVADGEHVELGSHEAAESILWRAHDRLAAHVETGVDQDRTARHVAKPRQELVEA